VLLELKTDLLNSSAPESYRRYMASSIPKPCPNKPGGYRHHKKVMHPCPACSNPVPCCSRGVVRVYCSSPCANKGWSARRTKGQKCIRCSSYGYKRRRGLCRPCLKECSQAELESYGIKPKSVSWTTQQTKYLKQHYSTKGAIAVAEKLGKSVSAVRSRAGRLGLTLTSEAKARLIHSKAREYMKAHNPMKTSEAQEKHRELFRTNDTYAQKVRRRLLRATQQIQKTKTSALEKKLQDILASLHVPFEAQVAIKDKFVVDIQVGNFILEADGDYWHGHPRFEPLTERQLKQQKRDRARNAYLKKCGYTVIRIWESDMTPEYVTRELRKYGILSSRALPSDRSTNIGILTGNPCRPEV
jgi:very-short-patch-repair endonuclease